MSGKVVCSFYNICKNRNKECHRCRWNAAINNGDFLLLETEDGKTIKLLRSI